VPSAFNPPAGPPEIAHSPRFAPICLPARLRPYSGSRQLCWREKGRQRAPWAFHGVFPRDIDIDGRTRA
jgi:hypothetical protein